MNIYGAADLHLKSNIWKSRDDITGDAYAAFAALVKLVMGDPGSALLLAGDVFDSTSPEGVDEYVFSIGMQKLLSAGHRVYGIPGNHDGEQYYRPLLFGLQEVSDNPVDIGGGIMVAGIPYMRSVEKLSEALANAPVCDILLMHAGFRHLLGFDEACQCESRDIPEHVDMVLNGHVHVHDVTGKVYSPGSLSVNSVTEFTAGHGVFRINTDTRQTDWIPIAVRHYIAVNWTEGDTVKIPEAIRKRLPVINLIYTNAQAAEVAAFKERNKERAVFLDNVQTLETIGGQDTVASCESIDVERVVHDSVSRRLGEDQEASHIALELTRTDEPAEWLERYLHETGLRNAED